MYHSPSYKAGRRLVNQLAAFDTEHGKVFAAFTTAKLSTENTNEPTQALTTSHHQSASAPATR